MPFNINKMNNITSGAADSSRAYAYKSTTDTLATIIANGYFDTLLVPLQIDDTIYIKGSDYAGLFAVSAATTTVILQSFGVLKAQVIVTSAQILALRATPITVIAAPGAGKIIDFISANLQLDYNAAAYAESADNTVFRYTGAAGVIVSQAIESTGFLDQTADTRNSAIAKIDQIAANSACENQSLVWHNTGDGEFTDGNSTIVIDVAYRIVNGV